MRKFLGCGDTVSKMLRFSITIFYTFIRDAVSRPVSPVGHLAFHFFIFVVSYLSSVGLLQCSRCFVGLSLQSATVHKHNAVPPVVEGQTASVEMERTADLTTFADHLRIESQGDAVIDRACPSSSAFVLRASELVSRVTASPHAPL